MEALFGRCLARSFTREQVQSLLFHSTQLVSFGLHLEQPEENPTSFRNLTNWPTDKKDNDSKKKDKKKKDKKKKDKKKKDKKKKDKKKKDKKKDKKKKDKKKKDKKKKDKKKDKKKKDKKKDKKKKEKQKEKKDKNYSEERGLRGLDRIKNSFEQQEDYENVEQQHVRDRLDEMRSKLAQKKRFGVSRFAPCMILYGEEGNTGSKMYTKPEEFFSFTNGSSCNVKKLISYCVCRDDVCLLLKKASVHALKSEQCWTKYIANVEGCMYHRNLHFCQRAFRPLERQCAEVRKCKQYTHSHHVSSSTSTTTADVSFTSTY